MACTPLLFICSALLHVAQHSTLATAVLAETTPPDISNVILHRNVPSYERTKTLTDDSEKRLPCDSDKGELCDYERVETPQVAPGYLRQSLAAASRFWGKRTRASEELKYKLMSSSRFWGGKRNAPTETDSIKGIEELKRKLKTSSPFWGKRSVDEAPETKGIDTLKDKLRSSSLFWGKRSGEQDSAKDKHSKPPTNDLRQQLTAYIRFWGKRMADASEKSDSKSTDDVRQQVVASSRFWGKRIPDESDDRPVETGSLQAKLKASSRFWGGKRSDPNTEDKMRKMSDDLLRSRMVASSRFWGKRSANELVDADQTPAALDEEAMRQILIASARFWEEFRSENSENSGTTTSVEPPVIAVSPARSNDFKQQLKSSTRFWGKRSDNTPKDSMKQKLKSSSRFWGKRSDVDGDDEQLEQQSNDEGLEEVSRRKRSTGAIDKVSLKEKLKASSKYWGKRNLGLPNYLKQILLHPERLSLHRPQGKRFPEGFSRSNSFDEADQPPQNVNEANDERSDDTAQDYVLDNSLSDSAANGAKQQQLQAVPLDDNQLRQRTAGEYTAEDPNLQLSRSLDPSDQQKK